MSLTMLDDPFFAAELAPESLEALMEGCANPGVTRAVLMLRLGELPPGFLRPHHLRLIATVLDPLLGLDRARLFRLADATVILVWRGAPDAAVQQALAALQRLLADLTPTGELATLLALPRDTGIIATALAASRCRVGATTQCSGVPIDPLSLMGLESALAQADVSPYLRRQPVCRMGADGQLTLAWERRLLSVRDLMRDLAPGIRPQSDPWLFRRLTRTLDCRMLALLCDPAGLRRAPSFSLDLNVTSILGPDFIRFDAGLPTALRGEIVLNLLPEDMLSDAAAYAFARDFAHARGYRLLLRHVTVEWLAVFPAETLGVDLIELRGGTDLPAGIDRGNLVFGEATSAEDIRRGHAQGIGFFRGPAAQLLAARRLPAGRGRH